MYKHMNSRAFHFPAKNVFFISYIPQYLYVDIRSINHFQLRLCECLSLHQSNDCICQCTHNRLYEHLYLTVISFPLGI